MSNGGAQHKIFGPYWDSANSTMYTQIYVYAYEAGAYTVAKDFWNNEDKSGGAIQSLQGGTDGTVAAYFDGDYAIRIKASDDTTVIASYPNVKITSDTATMWEGNIGTALPAAAVANAGQLFLKRDGSDNITGLYANDGKSGSATFQQIASLVSGVTEYDTLHTAAVPFFDVMHSDYGALGDDSQDDTSKIQLAIDAAEAASGGIVFFPEGTYKLTDALVVDNDNILFWGSGAGATILKMYHASNNMIELGAVNNITIQDMSLDDGTVRTGGVAIDFAGSNYCTLRNIKIIDQFNAISTSVASTLLYFENLRISDLGATTGVGISLDNGTNNVFATGLSINNSGTEPESGLELKDANLIWINDSHIQNSGIGIHMNPGAGDSCDNIFISNSRSASGGGDGIRIDADTATSTVTNVKINNCLIKGNSQNGLEVTGHASATIDGVYVDDTQIFDNTWHGINVEKVINLEVDSCNIAGNSNGSSGTYDGISIDGGVSLFQITNCTIGQQAGEANEQAYAIDILTGAGDEFLIANNSLVNNVTGGIRDLSTGTDKKYFCNLSDVSVTIASSATPSVPPENDVYNLSGTSTVTNITATVWDGRIVTFILTGAVDFTHEAGGSGQISLSGGANWTTGAANDTITIAYSSSASQWFEVSRSIN